MTTVRLKSVPMVFVPGMVRYIQHVYKTDAKTARGIFYAAWPQLQEQQFEDLISGFYKIEGEDILLEMD